MACPNLLCSYGKSHSHEILGKLTGKRPGPLLSGLDGYLFTNHREHYYSQVDFYKDDWVPDQFVRCSGDKSCVSWVFGLPAILFDDQQCNAAIHNAGHPLNEFCVVKRGRKCNHAQQVGFNYESNPFNWPGIIENFRQRVEGVMSA